MTVHAQFALDVKSPRQKTTVSRVTVCNDSSKYTKKTSNDCSTPYFGQSTQMQWLIEMNQTKLQNTSTPLNLGTLAPCVHTLRYTKKCFKNKLTPKSIVMTVTLRYNICWNHTWLYPLLYTIGSAAKIGYFAPRMIKVPLLGIKKFQIRFFVYWKIWKR